MAHIQYINLNEHIRMLIDTKLCPRSTKLDSSKNCGACPEGLRTRQFNIYIAQKEVIQVGAMIAFLLEPILFVVSDTVGLYDCAMKEVVGLSKLSNLSKRFERKFM